MELEVKSWDACEVNFNKNFDIYNETDNPRDIEGFVLLLDFQVGEVGDDGAANFSVLVVPYDVAYDSKENRRRQIVLPLFDIEIAKQIVIRTVKYVEQQQPEHWGHALSAYFHYEYEDNGHYYQNKRMPRTHKK